jgi:anti-anti-sigma factor
MSIIEDRQGSKLTLSIDMRLDAITAPKLAEKLEQIVRTDKTVKLLVIDMTETSYLSSLGLRVLIQGLKLMKSIGGNLSIQNINPKIRPVFEMTGLMDLMVRDEKLIILRKNEARKDVTLSLVGKLIDETVSQFEMEIKQIANGYSDIYLDCSELKFIANTGFKALRSVRDHISKDRDGVLMLTNVHDRVKRLLVSENLDTLIYSSPVIVKMEYHRAFFSLIGCVGDLDVPMLRKPLEEILEHNKVREIYFYLESLITISKQAVLTLIELRDKLVKNGVAIRVTAVNPDSEIFK